MISPGPEEALPPTGLLDDTGCAVTMGGKQLVQAWAKQCEDARKVVNGWREQCKARQGSELGCAQGKAKQRRAGRLWWCRGAALGLLEWQGSAWLSQQPWAELFRPELSWKGQVKMKGFF